jgi:hypothetical protein
VAEDCNLSFSPSFTAPDRPVLKVLPDQISKTSCSFRWDAPNNPRGDIQSYNVFIKFLNFSYFNPTACKNNFQTDFEKFVMADAGNELTFNEAFPFASYSIQVQAKNREEVSEYSSPPETCETLPGMLILKTCSIVTFD